MYSFGGSSLKVASGFTCTLSQWVACSHWGGPHLFTLSNQHMAPESCEDISTGAGKCEAKRGAITFLVDYVLPISNALYERGQYRPFYLHIRAKAKVSP